MDVNEIKQHVDGAVSEVKRLVQRQQDEIKTTGETASNTASELKKAEERMDSAYKDLEEKLEDHNKRMEEVEKAANRMPNGGSGGGEVKLSPGQRFILSKEYQAAQKEGTPNTGRFGIDSMMEEKGFSPQELKDIVGDDATSGQALIQPDRDFTIYRDPARRLNHIRQMLGVRTTTSNMVEFIQHLGGTPAFPQATSQAGEGSTKGTSDMAFELKQRAVVTLAHTLPASRQVLEDSQQLRSYIDDEMINGLMMEEDNQILYADGTGNTLNGIMNEPIQDVGQRANTDTPSLLDHIRTAVTNARLSNYIPDGILINPQDWEKIETEKGSDGQYIWAVVSNVAQGAEPLIWRIPVMETNAINSDDFLIGNWTQAARLWDRRQAAIRMSESHSDYFARNMVEILAEERLCLTVNRPKAFVKGKFTVAV